MKKNLLLAALLCAPVCLIADNGFQKKATEEAPGNKNQTEQAVCRCENDCNCLESRQGCICVNRGNDDEKGCGGVCGKNVQCADACDCDGDCAEETAA